MTRRKPTAHENHERWLVSYADFITLLFALFVVMFATAQADKAKARAVSDSVRAALEHGNFSKAITSVLGRGKSEAALPAGNPAGRAADLHESLKMLEEGLQAELRSGKVQLRLERRGLVVSLREAAFFASGDDAVQSSSLGILARIAAGIRPLPNPIRLEGHTDSIPIRNLRFRNNWELSVARSIAILQLFRDRCGIPSSRMAVAGYAENVPADTNETAEGRAHNRRVDLVVLSPDATRSEPQLRTAP